MVNSSTSFKSAPESWLPICLPKFTDKGFLHAYISFPIPSYPGPASNLCIVLVSQDRDTFFEMADCKRLILQVNHITRVIEIDNFLQHLNSTGTLFSLQDAIRKCAFSPGKFEVTNVHPNFMQNIKMISGWQESGISCTSRNQTYNLQCQHLRSRTNPIRSNRSA
jgi:hypothetical protein